MPTALHSIVIDSIPPCLVKTLPVLDYIYFRCLRHTNCFHWHWKPILQHTSDLQCAVVLAVQHGGYISKLKLFCLDVVFLLTILKEVFPSIFEYETTELCYEIFTQKYMTFSRHVPRGFWYTWSFLILLQVTALNKPSKITFFFLSNIILVKCLVLIP